MIPTAFASPPAHRMSIPVFRRALVAAAALALYWAAGTAPAAEASVTVTVMVNVIPTTGACSATSDGAGFGVSCVPPGLAGLAATPTLINAASMAVGQSSSPLFGTLLPGVLSDSSQRTTFGGQEISSWRTVSLDNQSYVELTIAW